MIDKNKLLWLVVDFHVLLNFPKFPKFLIYKHLSNILSFWNCNRQHSLFFISQKYMGKDNQRDTSKWSASLLLDLRKQDKCLAGSARMLGVRGGGEGPRPRITVPPPQGASNNAHLAPILGFKEGKRARSDGRQGVWRAIYHVLGRRWTRKALWGCWVPRKVKWLWTAAV